MHGLLPENVSNFNDLILNVCIWIDAIDMFSMTVEYGVEHTFMIN